MANFATWNPLAYKVATHTGATYSEGNTLFTVTQVDTYGQFAVPTMAMPTYGKWYAELKITTSGSDWPQFGFIAESDVTNMLRVDNIQGSTFANFSVVRCNDGAIFARTSTTATTYGSGFSSGDIVMLAYDGTTGKVWWGKNGTWFNSGDPAAGTGNGDTMPNEPVFITAGSYVGAGLMFLNCGQFPFRYDPPSGFVALSTENLAEPPISNLAAEKPEDHFNTVLYTGSGTNQSITTVGFESDLIWVKQRNAADNHVLVDSVRGYSKELYPNLTNGESGNTGAITATSTGFDLGSGGDLGRFNENTSTYVAWCWKAGGTAVSNTDGSITSQVSANTDAGFSVVSYEGNSTDNATVGHGLGKTPGLIILKNRDGANSWRVYHSQFGTSTGQTLYLESTSASSTDSNNIGSVNSTVFDVGYVSSNASLNASGNSYIAYCWSEIEGFSSIGSYAGNGSTDGSFVYTGFRPSMIILKRSDSGGSWTIQDIARDATNPNSPHLFIHASEAEASTTNEVDFLSNGFKLRHSSRQNTSGATYIYMAFAESPFKYSSAR